MDDLISRQAAIDLWEKYHPTIAVDAMQYDAELRQLPSAQPEHRFDEWCTDCKEYDQERHCCPRFNHVIRTTLQEVQEEQKKGKWIEHEVKRFDGCHTGRFFGECSECGKLTPEWRKVTESPRWYFCPNCGADMRGEKE